MDQHTAFGLAGAMIVFAPYFAYLAVNGLRSRKRKNEALRTVKQITARDSSWGR